jgi:hypothetical protein
MLGEGLQSKFLSEIWCQEWTNSKVKVGRPMMMEGAA